ncbi:aminotransferase class V-fold PLP-dependent enzyme [Aliarcobacter butzleri]|uniref:aminotransferase class V-fold PLP-dependent enzyme n=3 Tax=Aliarcobacter butzleri TaxID=28197 RepID=UPI00125EAD5B|nr:aminotransferase class V-fold PLP-dependent enzyme [Aliarcobacter butzleri]MCT7557582.1 aminotransferase class V-fold PLP-dependent enzyme [Aliarcobacter butzleri]MCT7563927.1 aminotransferase class V-fold PLP-dependent enzyme [Aliarcobacter butzleri]MCT7571446.1 aminotransferase class V-fold PLP-dependent enzyme [Aliarcobacter butzleri]MCT7573631.1 aminotransferase class V-fold PLP-dependent enzyme [Aliarcobacter butzleri]MCT7584700.1 aminotransferase class V-fold PLP-dependent enzyme [Ali
MNKDIFRPFFDKNADILNFIRYNTIGKNKKEYFDYTASGLGFRQIENRIHDVLETYANTHSKEASNADKTTNYYERARINLAHNLELTDDFAILPSGCGSTAAIKHFQELLGLYIPPATKKRFNFEIDEKNAPLVIVGPYEHHSNEVSFREALCETQRVNLDKDGLVDLNHLKEILEKNKNREIIASFCIASNVTGIITPYEEISKILRAYNAIICFDAAASSPYMNIPCHLFDAMFMSSHKLLGGPGSCGLLVIRKDLIDTSIAPTFAGGGTVEYVNKNLQLYQKEIEAREDAGTPGILQLIRASLAYQLRNEISFDFIKKQKDELKEFLINELKKIPNCVIYGNQEAQNIGIISFNIRGLSPYDLCNKISSQDGFQTRAGCSCAGPYGHDLLGIKELDVNNRPGWVRISVHFSQTKEDIKDLIESIKRASK